MGPEGQGWAIVISEKGQAGGFLDPLESLLPFTLSFQLQSKLGASEGETDKGAGSLGVPLLSEASKQHTGLGHGSLPSAVCSGWRKPVR